MQQFIVECKQCGAQLEFEENHLVTTCKYCGSLNTIAKSASSNNNLFNRANYLRRSNEFDKAIAVYEEILKEDATETEAHWGIVLCKYGIEYVEEPGTNNRIPTCRRTQFDSIFIDNNYKEAIKYSPYDVRTIYENEAKVIDNLQKKILEISSKEEPFDVFICYKERETDDLRTEDSVIAQELYYELEKRNFKVFFARKTLEGKLGSAYEPIIFAALNSSKAMVVLGTKPEYFNSVWVKNEWSRFRERIKKGDKKVLIPAYRNMSPYDLPQEFSNLQALDMSKLGFMQDLVEALEKIIKGSSNVQQSTISTLSSPAEGLLKRAYLFLEDGDYKSANEYFERVLDQNPEESRAYIGKLMIQLNITNQDDLSMSDVPLTEYRDFKLAIRFAIPEQRDTYESLNKTIIERIEMKKLVNKSTLFELNKAASNSISTKANHTVALKNDGTVVAVGNKRGGKCNMLQWNNITAISAGNNHTIGLRSDGTVVAVGNNYFGQCNVSDWTSIVAISAGAKYTICLKSDGTVVAVGDNYFGQCNVSDWTGIVAISAGAKHTIGLKSDGTVAAVGSNEFKQCNLSDWTGIVAISAGAKHTIGLKGDSTVVAVGDNYFGQCNVFDWRDIVSIAAGADHTIGLKKDGKVISVGDNIYDQRNIFDWENIIAISAGECHTIGLRDNGTVVAVGNDLYGICQVTDWNNIFINKR